MADDPTQPPELDAEDVLTLDDPYSTPENVAVETMDPVEVGNVFAMGFCQHARHLDGGDLLFDGGYTLTY